MIDLKKINKAIKKNDKETLKKIKKLGYKRLRCKKPKSLYMETSIKKKGD